MFELGGEVVPVKMAHNLTRLIAEGAGEGDDAADAEMRSEVVATYLDLLQQPKLSGVLLMVRFVLFWFEIYRKRRGGWVDLSAESAEHTFCVAM